MFTFIRDRWRALDRAWRVAIGSFLIARIGLSAWAFAVSAFVPLAVSNADLHGEPVVTAFDLRSSARAVFSRRLDGTELHFRASPQNLADVETNSVWDLGGRAVSGARSGAQLPVSAYSVEEVFPYRGVAPSQNIWLAPWQRFDASWYQRIAERGYGEDGSAVYFPLYPFLIRIIGTGLLGNGLLGAILISNAALVGALYLFYRMASDLIGEINARRALAFFLLFPAAFFLVAPYTESLFLLFALASLRAGQRARWGRAGVWGALAALTRLQGVLLLAPLMYLWFKDKPQSSFTFQARRFIPLLLIPLSTLGFLAFTNLSLLGAYETQLHARFVLPWDNLFAALAAVINLRACAIDLLNLLFTLLFGTMVALTWSRLPREYGLYSITMYLAPLLRMTTEQPLVSMVRYSLVIFPAFILWGRWGANRWTQRAIVYLSLPLLLFLSAQFFLWGWVG